jgi:hypothetical protein
MAKSSRRHSTKSSTSSRDSSSTSSYRTAESYETQSTAPTSTSSRPSVKFAKVYQAAARQEDISPSTSCCPRASVDTYNSEEPSDVELDDPEILEMEEYSSQEIPPLPVYRREVIDTNVLPTTPQEFARLFPSMNRLSIRHDDLTPDGNMNLRVETAAPGRRRTAMQLFHLRMYDLAKREFSLRRYCRESGREICNAKRKYVEQPAESAGSTSNLHRSVSSAFKFKRTNSGGSLFGSGSKSPSASSKRPSSRSSTSPDGEDEINDYFSRSMSFDRKHKAPSVPSNTIKLEFSNYARVDVSRRGGRSNKRYEFEWWGHSYAWKRVADKNVEGVVSYHLVRDGIGAPVAHIVPETRSPNQVAADEEAGGWVPPCYMWISDRTIIDAMTDVADVIVASGLIALVDDCIKERWGKHGNTSSMATRLAAPLSSVFHRRHHSEQPASPLRIGHPISAY